MSKISIFADVKRAWETAGLTNCAGVPDTAIQGFSDRYGVPLADDLAEYFRTVDGMNVGEYDEHEIRFWPLSELRPVTEELTSTTSSQVAGFFVFADYSLWAHAYAIRLGDVRSNQVALVGGEKPIRIAESFSEFMFTYLRHPNSLFPK